PLWARTATGTSVTTAETMSARSARRVTLAMTEPSGRGLGGSGRVQPDDRLRWPRSPQEILRKGSRRGGGAPPAAAELLLEPMVGVGLAVEGRDLDEAARAVEGDRLGEAAVGLEPQHADARRPRPSF